MNNGASPIVEKEEITGFALIVVTTYHDGKRSELDHDGPPDLSTLPAPPYPPGAIKAR